MKVELIVRLPVTGALHSSWMDRERAIRHSDMAVQNLVVDQKPVLRVDMSEAASVEAQGVRADRPELWDAFAHLVDHVDEFKRDISALVPSRRYLAALRHMLQVKLAADAENGVSVEKAKQIAKHDMKEAILLIMEEYDPADAAKTRALADQLDATIQKTNHRLEHIVEEARNREELLR